MEKILTIIIPTYNMEKYLHRCLDSLILSDEEMLSLEVLVINDGSKDSSSQIAHEYESKYPQTFRVIDKENGNYGSCINCGLKEATSKYIKILDADDSFDNQVFSQFMNIISTISVDLIFNDFVYVNNNGDVIRTTKYLSTKSKKVFSIHEVLKELKSSEIQMHGFTYNREKLIKLGYTQTEGISYTDQEWVFSPFSFVDNVFSTNCILYKYLTGREGQTMDPRIRSHNFAQNIICLKKMLKEYSSLSQTISAEKRDFMRYRLGRHFYGIYKYYLIYDNQDMSSIRDLDDYVKNTNSNFYEVLNTINISHYFPLAFIKIWRRNRNRHLPQYYKFLIFVDLYLTRFCRLINKL